MDEGDPVEEKAPHFHVPIATAIAATAITPNDRSHFGVLAKFPIARPVIES